MVTGVQTSLHICFIFSGHEASTYRTDSVRRDSVPEEAAVCGFGGEPEDRQALANRRGDGCQPHGLELKKPISLS